MGKKERPTNPPNPVLDQGVDEKKATPPLEKGLPFGLQPHG
jgi:hypothetical protein